MPRTPADRIHTRLRAREAARATRDEAIRAAHAAYAVAYPPEVEALLDDAAELAGLDERAPEPEPTKPPRAMSRGEVNRHLGMPLPIFDAAIALLTPAELAQLLVSAKARRQKEHIATLEREIGGRS